MKNNSPFDTVNAAAIWRHPCGHYCEWSIEFGALGEALGVSKEKQREINAMRIDGARRMTEPYARYPCPWCGAATGEITVPKSQKTIKWENMPGPPMFTTLLEDDDPNIGRIQLDSPYEKETRGRWQKGRL
jgi:hypothetical protein